MSVKQRLKTYIQYKEISERSFCIKIGVSTSYVSAIRTSIQPDKVSSIAEHYPDLNTGWLLTGDGKMLRSDVDKQEKVAGKVEEAGVVYEKVSNKDLIKTIQFLSETVHSLQKKVEQLEEQIKKTNSIGKNNGDAGLANAV